MPAASAPLVVVGGSIAALTAADAALGRGRAVELLLPRAGVGGGFRPLRVGGRRLDLGVRLLEIDREDAGAAPPLSEYRPGPTAHAPFVRHVADWVGGLVGERLREVDRPAMSLDGRLVDDIYFTVDLDGLARALPARGGPPHRRRGRRGPPPRGRRRRAGRPARPAGGLAGGGLARQPRRHLPRSFHRPDVRQDPPRRRRRGARRPAPQGVDAALLPAHPRARRGRCADRLPPPPALPHGRAGGDGRGRGGPARAHPLRRGRPRHDRRPAGADGADGRRDDRDGLRQRRRAQRAAAGDRRGRRGGLRGGGGPLRARARAHGHRLGRGRRGRPGRPAQPHPHPRPRDPGLPREPRRRRRAGDARAGAGAAPRHPRRRPRDRRARHPARHRPRARRRAGARGAPAHRPRADRPLARERRRVRAGPRRARRRRASTPRSWAARPRSAPTRSTNR